MLLTVVFDKTAIVKFKIGNNFKWNIFKTPKNPKENPYQPMDFKNPKKKSANQKSSDSCKMFVIS